MGPARWESVKLQFRPLYVVLVAALLVVSLSAGARAANPRVAATVPAAGDGEEADAFRTIAAQVGAWLDQRDAG